MSIYDQIDSNKRKTILFMIVFIAIVLLFGYFIGYLWGGYGYAGIIFAVLFLIPMTLVGYFASDKVALSLSGARPVTMETHKELYRIVENLCITAGIPMPKIYIIQDPALNAFATGRDPKHSSIALTTGLVDTLERTEVEGVVSHELSHIKNYDSRLMTLVIIFVGLILLLSNLFLRGGFIFGGRRGGGGGGGRDGGGQFGLILMLVGLALIIFSPLIAELIKLAISRKREYLADASGALLTRYPEGLASALEKIKQSPLQIQRYNTATAHLYIAEPRKKGFLTKLSSTHPPIKERIRKLREML